MQYLIVKYFYLTSLQIQQAAATQCYKPCHNLKAFFLSFSNSQFSSCSDGPTPTYLFLIRLNNRLNANFRGSHRFVLQSKKLEGIS